MDPNGLAVVAKCHCWRLKKEHMNGNSTILLATSIYALLGLANVSFEFF